MLIKRICAVFLLVSALGFLALAGIHIAAIVHPPQDIFATFTIGACETAAYNIGIFSAVAAAATFLGATLFVLWTERRRESGENVAIGQCHDLPWIP
jgi:hypothetical protein